MTQELGATTGETEGGRPSPLVSVVVPAHNEALGLARALETIGAVLTAHGVAHEIVVVDDGSRDETFSTVRSVSLNQHTVRGIRLSKNFGKEAALLAGLETARGDAVITIDADLQHPPSLIPEMLAAWKRGAQVVHAVKRDRSLDGPITRWRASLLHSLVSYLGGVDVRNSSDFKLLDRVAVSALVGEVRERSRFYRGLADWIGFEQVSIPFDVAPREAGNSKWSLRALLRLATTAIVSFTSAPLRLVTIFGLLTLSFAALITADTLWSWWRGTSVSGFATLEITLLFLGSLIMISLGIVGEYVGKIYIESKQRPPYLVSARCGFEERDPGNPR